MISIEKYKPGVRKFWLYFTAALVWSGVGIYLALLAVRWLVGVNLGTAVIFAGAGLLLAGGIYAVMFKRFADQNIARIQALKGERICIFALQRWSSYPLVVIMMSMGIYLRVYSPVPKPYAYIPPSRNHILRSYTSESAAACCSQACVTTAT